MHPKLIPVQSSNIAGYYYLQAQKQLLIAFKSGSTYAYEGVEQDVVAKFANAPSKGRFFRTEVRLNYPNWSRLQDSEVEAVLATDPWGKTPRRRRKKSTVSLASLTKRYPVLASVF